MEAVIPVVQFANSTGFVYHVSTVRTLRSRGTFAMFLLFPGRRVYVSNCMMYFMVIRFRQTH